MVSRQGSAFLTRREPSPLVLHQVPPGPWPGGLRRGKLRCPDVWDRAIARPRLRQLINQRPYPLTLVVAPAGFGKTIAAAQWASEASFGWLTADAEDASLNRFWAHLREALQETAPGVGELVTAALDVPHRVAAIELGRLLADELLDHTAPVRVVIDDLHLIPAGPVSAFLAGLLELPPPGLRLLITSRCEPPLPLHRLRIRNQINEVRSSDLLFSDDEIRVLIGPAASADRISDLRCRTAGWAAGLRLAAATGIATSVPRQPTAGVTLPPAAEVAAALLEETLPAFSATEQALLLRAALPDRFNRELVTVLAAASGDDGAAAAVINHARAADLCRLSPHGNGEWLEFQPIFRTVLRHRLAAEEGAVALTRLHQIIAGWFAARDDIDAAIVHWLAAGLPERAVALVQHRFHTALAAEDWPAIERWLALLPATEIERRPQLLVARAWLAHLHGQYSAKREIVQLADQRLAAADHDPDAVAALRAELDVLRLDNAVMWQISPEHAVQLAHRARAGLTPDARFPLGLAWLNLGMALHCAGHPEGERTLQSWSARTPAGIDGGSIRGLLGLSLLYLQEGELIQAERAAETMIGLAERHQLRLTAEWGHAILGDILYEQNRLEEAVQQNIIVSREYEHAHFLCLREALFTLAQTYSAGGAEADAAGTMRRAHDFLLAAEAVEHLPVLAAYEAWLALLAGDTATALRWARHDTLGVDCSSLITAIHPVAIRAAILCASGDAVDGEAAIELLTELRTRAARVHMTRPLIRTDALLAVARLRRGERQAASEAMRASLAVGVPRGFVRSYLDLIRVFPAESRKLLTGHDLPTAIATAIDQPPLGDGVSGVEATSWAGLTQREWEILAALGQGFTYDEIGQRLFISPHTVKRHACNIYGKLGVSGRFEALRMAHSLGWQASVIG